MGIALPAFCNFQPKMVKIGMTVWTVTMLVILIICFATFGWVVDYSSFGCDYSLQEVKCSGTTSDLQGDPKDAGDAMAGLGATAFIFLFIDLVILVIFLIGKFQSYNKILLITGMVCVGMAWLFLTAGWGHYSDKKGGLTGSVDYGASFAFTVIMWLCLFPYAFFWFWLFNAGNDAESDQQAQQEGTPSGENYAPDPAVPTYTKENAGDQQHGALEPAGQQASAPPHPPSSQEAPAPEPVHQEPEVPAIAAPAQEHTQV